MTSRDDLATFLDNPFHGAALSAFVEQARLQQSWPCPEATRRRAYQLYEAELAAKPSNLVRNDLPEYDDLASAAGLNPAL